MQPSDACLDLIKSFEGYHTALPDGRCAAYLDKLAKPHVWTIGWGCTKGIRPGMIWTRDEAEAALRAELDKHAERVNRLVTVEIGQSNFDALVSFDYNCGALGKSTLLRKLNKGDFDGAAREFDRWVYAGGVKYKGLVRRRAAERALFEQDAKDDIPPTEPQMPQQVAAAPTPPGRMSIGLGSLLTGGTISAGIAQTKEGVSVIKDIKSIAPPVSSFVYPSLIVALGLVAAVIIWRRTA